MYSRADFKTYARLIYRLPGFFGHSFSPEQARAILDRRMAERESNFLRIIDKGIFRHARSPYLPLLKMAGCGQEDIREMVRSRGLEETLRTLREAGVCITFEEFKGRAPIVRGGLTHPVKAQDFDNPYLSSSYQLTTGGTTGAGTRVVMDLDFLLDTTPSRLLAFQAHGVLGAPTALWYGILPDGTAINNLLRSTCFGTVPRKWFTPVTSSDVRPALIYRLATWYIVLLGRLRGHPIPWPEPVRMDQAVVIARWISQMLKSEGRCLLRAHVSMAVRVCVAAREAGLDLTGATLMGGGEPPTPAKVREITASGAHWVPTYVSAETGPIGYGCANPAGGTDVHFLKDGLALIQHPRPVLGSDVTVDAFYFTTLLPTAPKLMLNVGNDDYGVVERRSCGCPLESCGYTEHLRDIHSYSKLTGEGMTLIGSDMLHILQEVLPSRFGGSSLDYQLIEEEDERGFTRLSLVVSPKVRIDDDRQVIETVLEELRRGTSVANLARAQWSQAQTLRVKRMEPISTARGKMMPLHLTRRAQPDAEGRR